MTGYGRVSQGPAFILKIILEQICSIYHFSLVAISECSGFLFRLMDHC